MLMFGTDGRTIVGWNLSMAFSWDVLAVQNPHQCHLRVKKRWMVRCGSRASVGGVVGLVEKRRNFAFVYITWRQRLPLFARNILEQHKDPKCGSFFSPSNHKCLATLRLCWRCYSICYLVGSSFGKTYNYFLYFFMNRFHNESGTFSRTKMGKKSVLERSSLSNRLPWDLHSENCQLWTFEHLWFLSPTYRGTRVGWRLVSARRCSLKFWQHITGILLATREIYAWLICCAKKRWVAGRLAIDSLQGNICQQEIILGNVVMFHWI